MSDASSPDSQPPAPAEAVPPQRPSQPRCVMVGIGASAGGLEAFEMFFTHMPPDSGLAFVLVGLYIMREIVAAHGGQLTVQSVEGHGSTFTLTLPRPARVASRPDGAEGTRDA
jgi:hypothetical protein